MTLLSVSQPTTTRPAVLHSSALVVHGRHGNHYVITVPLEVHVVSVVPEERVVLEVHVVPEVLLLVSPTFVAPLEARSLKMPSAPIRSIMPVVPEVLASPPASSRL